MGAGFLIFLVYIAFFVYLLVLLVRFVNAMEKIANASERQERQVGRLANAVEQLASTQGGGTRPNDSPDEGPAQGSTGKVVL